MMTPKEFKQNCRGIYPVQFCPFTKEGEVDVDGLRQNTEFLLDFAKGGKHVSIMTNGSTTEWYANTADQQKTVIKTVLDTVSGKIPVVVGVGQAATPESIKWAQHAEEHGADCVMVVLPFYHKPTKEGMYKHFVEIADSINIGLMIYNNPCVSSVLMGPDLLQKLSKHKNIVAIKDNSPIIGHYFHNSVRIDPKDLILLNGFGEMRYLGSAAYGYKYRGFISFIANFLPSYSYDIYEAVEQRDFVKAQASLEQLLPLFNILDEFKNRRPQVSILPPAYETNYMYMSVGKAGLDLVGLNGGHLKHPLEDLTADEKNELKRVLEKLGAI